jgi:hypothetical protein
VVVAGLGAPVEDSADAGAGVTSGTADTEGAVSSVGVSKAAANSADRYPSTGLKVSDESRGH